MVRVRGWHLGAFLSLLWFVYHVWAEWLHHDRAERFEGRAATEQWAPTIPAQGKSRIADEAPRGAYSEAQQPLLRFPRRRARSPLFPFIARGGRSRS
jgi:hypothetical protein